MKALILSDIHPDMYYSYAVKPNRLRGDDPKEDVVFDTLDWMWKMYEIPMTPAILIAGDLSNDYLTLTRTIKWLSNKYEQVYFCFGNHDLIVRGATVSKSNLQFTSSEQKLNSVKEFCTKYPNIHLLEGDVVNGIGGCMMTCDLKCEAMPGFDHRIDWKRNWFDGLHWRYMNNEPGEIWNHYDKLMENIIAQKPKIIMTHFAPYQVGVNFKFRNSGHNKFFYFDAEKYLNELNDTIWICGHIHDRKICNWVNETGGKVKILCNPFGYPGEHDQYADYVEIKDNEYKRDSLLVKHDDYIIDI